MNEEIETVTEVAWGEELFYRCTAEEISECVERDSRRYDNGFEEV